MSIVFNNAQLPNIVRPERMGWLSGFGWGLGYCGGLIALFIVLAVSMPSMFGSAARPPLFGLDAATHGSSAWSARPRRCGSRVFVIPMFLFTPDTARRAGCRCCEAARQGGCVAGRHGAASSATSRTRCSI